MKYLFLSVFCVLLSAHAGAGEETFAGDDVLGLWWTQDEKAKIEIYKKDGKYCGKITWLEEPLNDEGEPKLDKNNKDKSLRSRPVMGMDLISGFTYENGKWQDGEVYDPESGKTYSCVMKLNGDKLEVRGYVRLTIFGRTVVWTRAK